MMSNVGSWMQDTAGTWLITVLTSSPLLIALMQTAASLPVVLLGVLAGATADIFDRRRLLIFWQAWMLGAVVVLSILTFFGVISPWGLLISYVCAERGHRDEQPRLAGHCSGVVPRSQLPEAISLNSAGFNLARAVGPALGGLAWRHSGIGYIPEPPAVFLLNSMSFVGVIVVLYRWRRTPLFKSTLPAERIYGSVRSGVRYMRHAPVLQATLLRAFFFTIFVSAVWALLALVAYHDLHQGALGDGILNGSIGLGAVFGAVCLPRIRRTLSGRHDYRVLHRSIRRDSRDSSLRAGAGHCYSVSYCRRLRVDCHYVHLEPFRPNFRAFMGAGAGIGRLSNGFPVGHGAGQLHLGRVAEHFSTPTALLFAGLGLLATLPLARRFHVLRGATPDLRPYQLNRSAPALGIDLEPTDGPVRVSIAYRVLPEDHNAFTRAIHQLRGVRLRDGAIRWGVFQDVTDPDLFDETFIVESWLEYLRQRKGSPPRI